MDQLFKKRNEELKEFSSWLKRHKVKEKKEIPENIFKQCDHCHESIPYFSLIENDYVCPKCGYHMKISARQRIRDLIDDGSWREYFEKDHTENIENFPGYDAKLKKAQMSTGMNEAVICGIGKINQNRFVLCVMDSRFMMGSMGKVVGEKICKAVELATRKKLPLVISCTSGGARMQEGIDSLMQMAKISAALKRFSNQSGLYIALLTHPTTGGVSASFAMLGDIIIAEPQAMIGFAGKRVIQDTIKQELPEGFQTAEFLLEKGFIDMIVQRHDLKNVISDLLKLHGGKL
ncbi:acetyl-CoA carboxylase, carboxyltransferase subunit beta [Massilimicrobiota timonensis]|uniref:acetyl-CoA carboxylase, carboxyltransferase subunit beta n=1 Tax=Massilimicrobiota timonensis TaxID=1776392 RepID=UPI0019611487|nr:acetyl-CoA carboxylase, carboxyltransferase subunit beta [Massilimicrobiota timonensis]MBM6965822.1 acetyl-CoA carboxylase carboxyltransferase subunit beta [Massilimicrobiota timonensis]